MISHFHYCVLQTRKVLGRGAIPALAVVLSLGSAYGAPGQQLPWSQRIANSTLNQWSPTSLVVLSNGSQRWDKVLGILLDGMDAVWYQTANGAYYQYTKQAVGQFVATDGSIATHDPVDNELETIALGKQLLLLYRVTQDAKYYKAAVLLRKHLAAQPRNASGGFWHKQSSPDQMWLEGLYFAEPFYAEYASLFQERQDFADITRQFSLIERHTRSPKTGLLYNAWDESRPQAWADKSTGRSRVVRARDMGWYMMALVESLSYYPRDDPSRTTLLAILNRAAAAVVRYQDKQTGLWYQVLDEPEEQGNYFEASAACMFTYALLKAVRLGYVPQHFSQDAARSWQGILRRFAQTDADGSVRIRDIVAGSGLGGTPGHDRTYDDNVTSPAGVNDAVVTGAFLLAATEVERAPEANLAHGETVMLDAWFNSQTRQNAAAQKEYFHYKWDDYSDSGFSIFGQIFTSHGATLDTLYQAPTLSLLMRAQYYIIVSPDIPAKNPHPHYVQQKDAEEVAEWVKQGGFLILMENDPANADIEHLDLIADRFGIHFNDSLSHHVVGDQFAAGQIPVSGGGPLFQVAHTLYMKDTCTIGLTAPATSLLNDKTGVIMATAKYGKGKVFAVIDPWLYNEYTDHRKVVPEQDNYAAGEEFVSWLLKQTPRNASQE